MTALRGWAWVIACPKKFHGLGNRLRLVLGSESLAEWTGRSFAYSWPVGRAFGARLDELWRYDRPTISGPRARLLTLRHPYRREDLTWMPDAADDRVWMMRTPHALRLPAGATPWGQRFRELELVSDLATRVTAFHAAHLAGGPYIGVMVRTHPVSNAQTLERSPLSWFIDRMAQARRERPDVPFFVSADTTEGQRAILDAFPRSYALADKGAYNTEAALRSSVVDLYLLAGAGHVLGPHYSSFPELSQQLAGVSLRLETSMTSAEARLDADGPLEWVDDPLHPFLRRSD